MDETLGEQGRVAQMRNQKRTWSKEEDQKLVELVKLYGPQQWNSIAKTLKMRSGKQCRERWHNQLDPCLKKKGWCSSEEWVLFIL